MSRVQYVKPRVWFSIELWAFVLMQRGCETPPYYYGIMSAPTLADLKAIESQEMVDNQTQDYSMGLRMETGICLHVAFYQVIKSSVPF